MSTIAALDIKRAERRFDMDAHLFVETIADMYENGELDKICNMKYHAHMGQSRFSLWYNRKMARRLKRALCECEQSGRDIRKIPFIVLLHSMKSAEVIKDAICIMVGKDKRN